MLKKKYMLMIFTFYLILLNGCMNVKDPEIIKEKDKYTDITISVNKSNFVDFISLEVYIDNTLNKLIQQSVFINGEGVYKYNFSFPSLKVGTVIKIVPKIKYNVLIKDTAIDNSNIIIDSSKKSLSKVNINLSRSNDFIKITNNDYKNIELKNISYYLDINSSPVAYYNMIFNSSNEYYIDKMVNPEKYTLVIAYKKHGVEDKIICNKNKIIGSELYYLINNSYLRFLDILNYINVN